MIILMIKLYVEIFLLIVGIGLISLIKLIMINFMKIFKCCLNSLKIFVFI